MEEVLKFFTGPLNHFVWQYLLLPCVFLGGLFFTVRCHGMQFFRFGHAMKETAGKIFEKKKASEGSVTPFQALTMALSSTVGTGSIVGTCQAIALGGSGAVFWLWVAAFFGMIIKFAEVTLAIVYRRRNGQGEWVGGPMYTILGGMGKKWKPLAVLFSFFAVLASFGMGNLSQANSIAGSVSRMAELVFPLSSQEDARLRLGVGICIALFLSLALLGGMGRIGKVTEILVPAMSLFFILSTLAVIGSRISSLPGVFRDIVTAAFAPQAVFGAGAGITMGKAMEWGLKRSAFSNEAGLGSAAIAHAAADTDSAVRQGFYGIFEVFADTIVICTLTALSILVALPTKEIFSAAAPDAGLITSAFATCFGSTFAVFSVGLSLILFAFSTLLGWSLYGARCMEFLFGKRARIFYQILFVILSALGACLSVETVWGVSDTFNGLMAIPNFISLFSLSGVVFRLVREYFQKKGE